MLKCLALLFLKSVNPFKDFPHFSSPPSLTSGFKSQINRCVTLQKHLSFAPGMCMYICNV